MSAFPLLDLLPAERTDAIPVVLLHGLASDAATDFEASGLVDALRSAGRPVVAVTLPGHVRALTGERSWGRAPASGGAAPFEVTGVLDAVVRGVRSLAGEVPVDVVGYSLGARLAWDLPAAGLEVRRAVLGGLAPQEPFAALDPGVLAGVVLRGEPAPDPLTGMIGGMLAAAPGERAVLVELVAALGRTPFTPESAPTAPVLVIAGDADPVAGDPSWATGVLPHGEAGTVPGDHVAALASAEFVRCAVDFLG